ncbi:hypothetical protein PsorP6_017736 [Peronosclerospora sorghi]|uniref:Uncharacterized protein n=1 Tax=Peronosclerospora sorghi TaxID=230839 RepID=A0ACC0WKD5_9STRA|nr:hypothetical protein PsorP6_017736 [Peronosclerospora sorghi]
MLQRKLDYVLHKLRLLEEIIVAEPGQVRFDVVARAKWSDSTSSSCHAKSWLPWTQVFIQSFYTSSGNCCKLLTVDHCTHQLTR